MSSSVRAMSHGEPPLDPVTLHAGQQIHGYVVFDVPKGTAGADVELYVGSALFRWNI